MNMHSSNIIPISQSDWSEKHEVSKDDAHMLTRAMELLVDHYIVSARHLSVDGYRTAGNTVAVMKSKAERLLKQLSDSHSIRIIPDEDQ